MVEWVARHLAEASRAMCQGKSQASHIYIYIFYLVYTYFERASVTRWPRTGSNFVGTMPWFQLCDHWVRSCAVQYVSIRCNKVDGVRGVRLGAKSAVWRRFFRGVSSSGGVSP